MSETPQKVPNHGKKRDRSNVDENGFNKDDRKRQELMALRNGGKALTSPSQGAGTPPVSPSKSPMVSTEAHRLACDILRLLREGKHPYAICNDLDTEEFEELGRFRVIEQQAVEWMSKWGGVACWAEWLEMSYNEAMKCYGFDAWFEEVWDHADKGRRLETRLFELHGTLPKEHYKVKRTLSPCNGTRPSHGESNCLTRDSSFVDPTQVFH
ncbi:hypothetical protein NP233_g9809 [Leucocoprinus birnbaumii]|uniref:Uncharacterized protein n=1 Tax=Leucocoprinus birnbaumii TaxID=56174 RepID=A0AAD5VKF4_9AGAR|nr:hypothetical protein NP233_g9809 [Leucocoprinus birnbaumii]